MSTEANKAIVRQWLDDVWQNGQLDRIPDYYTSDYTLDGAPKSLEQIRRDIEAVRTMLPDMRLTIHDMVAEGDTVAYRYSWQWISETTFQDDIFGTIPPTGNPVTVTAMTFVRLADGKIVEDWASMDMLSVYQQLGVVPMPHQTQAADA